MLAVVIELKDSNPYAIIGTYDGLVVAAVDSIDALSGITYQDISEDNTVAFNQIVFDKKYGETMTYQTFTEIKGLIDALGDDAAGAGSVAELIYRKRQQDYITSLELALVDLYEGSL